jgi:hypothetical protein
VESWLVHWVENIAALHVSENTIKRRVGLADGDAWQTPHASMIPTSLII